MHRNTLLVVIILAIFAALVIGVNIGRSISGTSNTTPATTQATPTSTPMTIQSNTYSNVTCGFTFDYPSTLTKLDTASGSATFVDQATNTEVLRIACQKDIPRPPLVAEKIETWAIETSTGSATISANLYHDGSPKDGTPIDIFIFKSPKNGLDVYLAGFGNLYNEIISTLRLLP